MTELNDKDAIQANGDAIWPRLIQELGLTPANYDPETIKLRTISGDSRIVILLSGKGVKNLIFKAEYPVGAPKNFQIEIDGHKRAYEAMKTADHLHIPDILIADTKTQSQIIEFAPGRPAHELLDLAAIGLGDRHEILERCGAWISTFHQNTFVRFNPVNPDAMLKSMAWHEDAVKSRKLEVPRRDLFLEYAAKIPAVAETIRGQETRVSATHGDMHLRNLLLDNKEVYGIDFSAMREVPTAHDVAKFLIRYGTYFYDDLDKDGADPFSPGDMDAFYQGYGAQYRDDPALTYLLPIELLMEWTLIPKEKSERSPNAQKRLHGVLRMGRIMFGDAD
ncbi:MAG: aminoglycoside phosphotransferase family protein [Marinosulfonomonas sp.]|nr:aminoglycoside phosphotransferase family protein [Marinosulfonomonas sp.]